MVAAKNVDWFKHHCCYVIIVKSCVMFLVIFSKFSTLDRYLFEEVLVRFLEGRKRIRRSSFMEVVYSFACMYKLPGYL